MSQDSAESYDVAARLAQGRPAVDTVQLYVSACHQLGYQHQDLTLHPSQVRDGYGTEDGMDLGALQRGCLALEAAAHASQEALAIEDRQLARFSTAWDGAGGDAARDFVDRHADVSAAVSAAVRTAAEALVALRERLWQAVTTKVDTVLAIEGRAGGSRAEWRAAATTVTSGAGDRSVASELVDGAVKPFVDNSIRTDWLAAMQTTVASVTEAYERALSEMAAERLPVFDVPGALGPGWTAVEPLCEDQPPAAPATYPAPAAPAATAPSSWSAPAPAPALAPALAAAPAPAVAPAPALPAEPAQAAAPPVPPLGAMGSGIPGMGGGGLSGLGQPFADILGGLLGGGGSGLPDLPEPDLAEPDLPEPDLAEPDLAEPDLPESELLEDPEGEEPEDEPEEGDDPVPEAEDSAAPVEEAVVTEGEDPPEEPCDPVEAPAPTPAPPPAEPLPPPAEPVVAGQTPCEIAADEVPQVGEQAE